MRGFTSASGGVDRHRAGCCEVGLCKRAEERLRDCSCSRALSRTGQTQPTVCRMYFGQCRGAIAADERGQSWRTQRREIRHQAAALKIMPARRPWHFRLLPLVPGFRGQYPGVNLEINISQSEY